MDESTEGVTLWGGFVFTVVEQCRGMERVCAPVFERVKHLDPEDPRAPVPIALYNEICDWIEQNLGAASVRGAGTAIGKGYVARLRRERELRIDSTPIDALHALARAVVVTITDPKRRGWEVLDAVDGSARVRRTQTFNCTMQEGVLLAVVESAGALMPRVEQVRCTRKGHEFCDYDVRWLVRKPSRFGMQAVKP